MDLIEIQLNINKDDTDNMVNETNKNFYDLKQNNVLIDNDSDKIEIDSYSRSYNIST